MGWSWGELRIEVEGLTTAFDASLLVPSMAEQVVRDVSATINMLETVRALAAGRAAEGGSWRREGARSPAHQLARQTGTSVGRAKEALDTGARLKELPALSSATRRGEVSPAQAAPIADAASADPSSEERLLEKAKRASLGELRDECDRTKAAAEPDDEARHAAIRRARYLRRRRHADGSAGLEYRSTVEDVAGIWSIVQGHAKTIFDEARIAGRKESEEAYLADGLKRAVEAGAGVRTPAVPSTPTGDDGSDSGPAAGAQETPRPAPPAPSGNGKRVRQPVPTKVIVRIDWDAFVRGWPIGGEVCEIAGLGPVPVLVARAMVESGDAFLAGVVTRGHDVVNVVHLGRKPTRFQETALEWLAPTCTTLGCNATERLQVDHREDWARTKVTLLGWLDHLCPSCHDKKTRLGWALVEGHGKRPFVPPDDPRHPRNQPAQERAG